MLRWCLCVLSCTVKCFCVPVVMGGTAVGSDDPGPATLRRNRPVWNGLRSETGGPPCTAHQLSWWTVSCCARLFYSHGLHSWSLFCSFPSSVYLFLCQFTSSRNSNYSTLYNVILVKYISPSKVQGNDLLLDGVSTGASKCWGTGCLPHQLPPPPWPICVTSSPLDLHSFTQKAATTGTAIISLGYFHTDVTG